MVDYLINHQLNSTTHILTLCEFLAEFCIKMTLHQSWHDLTLLFQTQDTQLAVRWEWMKKWKWICFNMLHCYCTVVGQIWYFWLYKKQSTTVCWNNMYGIEIRFEVTKLGNPPLQAANKSFTSPRYTWILHGWYPNRWWTKEVANETIACSDEQLEMFLAKSRTLIVNNLPAPTDSDIETTAGIVSYESILCILYTLKFCGRHTVQAIVAL